MKPKLFSTLILLAFIILTGCSSSYIITFWKNPHSFPGNYNKILVTAIVNVTDTAFRGAIENHFKESLEAMGYNAVSAVSEFGAKGLHDLGQEDAYITLCNKGIDAVMTVALVDKATESAQQPHTAYTNPSNYYYKRIWNYKDMQLSLPADADEAVMKYSWETILFDLSTLQPHYIAETRPFSGAVHQSIEREFWAAIIKKMTREKFLKKNTPIVASPKAF